MNHASFALHRGALIGLSLLLALALAACSGGGDGEGTAGGTVAVTSGTVDVSADNLAFDANVIQAPAGEAFTIVLTNDDGVPHNLSVYTEEGGDQLAKGEIINEGQSDEIEVQALEPGEYFFVCDLHTAEMRGTIVVQG